MDRQGRLLIVEDEPSLRRLVAEFLRGAGYECVQAPAGPDGVARHEDSGPFDLVLMDLNLPGFSGVEASRRILRSDPGQPILVCSAAITPGDEAALIALGVDDHLTKPYHPEVLLARIAAALRPVASARA